LRTIQITIDDNLLLKGDQAIHLKKIARLQFIRKSLEESLRQMAIEGGEEKQAEGYCHHPERSGEFDIWESEQTWG
jgi:metal-responsive CopG/Arc/MetJ family transcriptional regulator